MQIIRELLNGGVNVNDIGVISPYNSQVDLIRRFTTEACLPSLEVHTIDKYQVCSPAHHLNTRIVFGIFGNQVRC